MAGAVIAGTLLVTAFVVMHSRERPESSGRRSWNTPVAEDDREAGQRRRPPSSPGASSGGKNAEKPFEKWLKQVAAKLVGLDFADAPVADLSALRGMPLRQLTCSGS